MHRCPHAFGHPDYARRAADNVNMHYQAIGWPAVGQWCAIALQDGGSDHVLYDTRLAAVKHQHHSEQWYAFVKVRPMAMTECEAMTFLDFCRKAYDAGFRLTDPEHRNGGRQLILSGRPMETVYRQLAQLTPSKTGRHN